MGGIVVRAWVAGGHAPANLSRVVMLAPPHQGTPLVDRIGDWWFFRAFTGVNGRRLGTKGPDAFPAKLGPWNSPAQLGIVAGDRSLNPLFSAWIPGPDCTRRRAARSGDCHPLSRGSSRPRRNSNHCQGFERRVYVPANGAVAGVGLGRAA
jgi:hypothetical protein